MLSSSSSGSEEESEEDVIPVKPKLEPVEPDAHIPIPIQFQPKEEPMDHVTEAIEPQPENDLIQVPVVNSSSQAKSAEPMKCVPKPPASVSQPTPSKTQGNVKSRHQKRKFRPNVSVIPPRTLAIRQPQPPAPLAPQNIRFTVPAPSPVPAAYQMSLQSPPPPVLYVTRPEINPPSSTLQCSFISQPQMTVPQHHYIIVPPSMEQTFVQTNSCSSGLTLTQHASSPMVQYLGTVPSHLLSSLGIMTTNMGVANYTTVQNLSALLQSQPLQTWEPANQIVFLPQQSVLSFNLPSVSLQSAPQLSPAVATIQLSPAVAKEVISPVVKKTTSPKAANESTPVKSVVEPKATVPKQDSPKPQENTKPEKVEVLKEEEKKSDIPLNNNT